MGRRCSVCCRSGGLFAIRAYEKLYAEDVFLRSGGGFVIVYYNMPILKDRLRESSELARTDGDL